MSDDHIDLNQIQSNHNLVLKPIGFVSSCYRDRFAVPRQSLLVQEAEAQIVFEPWIQPELALEGIAEFSHLWIIFGFHLNKKSTRYHAKVHPPRLQGQTKGVLATRSPHRPNSIGLSLVQFHSWSGSTLEVRGGDLADGTPVYDIKPYLPLTESQPLAQGGWTTEVSDSQISVVFENEDIEEQCQVWAKSLQKPHLKDIIFSTLKRDPRPSVYQKADRGYLDQHAFRLFNGDVHFYFKEHQCIITKIIVFSSKPMHQI